MSESVEIQAEAAVGENPADYPQTPDELKRWIIQRAKLHLTYSKNIADLNEGVKSLTEQRQTLVAADGIAQDTLIEAIRKYQEASPAWVRQVGSTAQGGYVRTTKPQVRFSFAIDDRTFECFVKNLDAFDRSPALVIQEVATD